MHIVESVELSESPLRCWQRIAGDGGAALRDLGRQLPAEAGPFRTLLGFRPPAEQRERPVTFDCEVDPFAGPAGAVSILWDAGRARLEGRLEIVPDGAVTEVRVNAAYEPPLGATLVAGRAVLRRMVHRALQDFIHRAVAGDRNAAGDERRRLLIEDEDPAWHRVIVGLAGSDEWEFDGCAGPARAPGGCPVLRGDVCPKVEWADVILNSLDGDCPDNAALLVRLQDAWPDAAVKLVPSSPVTHCLIREPGLKKASSHP